MKIKKVLKIGFVVLGILFFLLCAFITIKEFQDVRTEEKLDSEVRRVEKQMTIKNIDNGKEKIDTGKIVSTGEYKKVEEAFKNYTGTYYKQAKNIHQNYKEIMDNDIETIEKIKQEKPDFVNSTEQLTTLKEMIEQENKNYEELLSVKTIISFMDSNTKKYYINYYRDIISRIKRNNLSRSIKKELNDSLELINSKLELLDFLKNNKEWDIVDDSIKYEDEELQKEYQNYLDNILITIKNSK